MRERKVAAAERAERKRIADEEREKDRERQREQVRARQKLQRERQNEQAEAKARQEAAQAQPMESQKTRKLQRAETPPMRAQASAPDSRTSTADVGPLRQVTTGGTPQVERAQRVRGAGGPRAAPRRGQETFSGVALRDQDADAVAATPEVAAVEDISGPLDGLQANPVRAPAVDELGAHPATSPQPEPLPTRDMSVSSIGEPDNKEEAAGQEGREEPEQEAPEEENAGQQSIIMDEVIASSPPTENDVLEYARWLGMDPSNPDDASLLWIARKGLDAALPPEWRPCQVSTCSCVACLSSHCVLTEFYDCSSPRKGRSITSILRRKRASGSTLATTTTNSCLPTRSSSCALHKQALLAMSPPVATPRWWSCSTIRPPGPVLMTMTWRVRPNRARSTVTSLETSQGTMRRLKTLRASNACRRSASQLRWTASRRLARLAKIRSCGSWKWGAAKVGYRELALRKDGCRS